MFGLASLGYTVYRRYFFSSRAGALVRSLARLCVVANFIGVMALVLVLSIMNGFRESQEKKLLAVEPHLVIEGPDAGLRFEEILGDSTSGLRSDRVDEIAPFEKQDIIVRTIDGGFSGAVAKGLEPQYLSRLLQRAFATQMRESDVRTQFNLGTNEVVMGSELARSLGVYEGDEVTFVAPESLLLPAGEIPPFEKVRVVAILATDIADIDAQMIFYDQTKSLARLKKTSSFERGIEVRLQYPQDAFEWKETLLESSVFGAGSGAAGVESPYVISTWGDRNSALFFALKMEKFAMTTFLSLSILITCFTLFTVLIMLITQKRKDIGLMMALGLSRWRTQKLFVLVGALLAFSGMLLGLFAGVGIALLLGHYSIPLLPADVYVDSRLPANVEWSQVAFITLGLVILGLLAAYLPVKSGINASPSDALRGRK